MTMRTLEQVIADQRGELAVLRKHSQGALADALERFANDVAGAAEDYLTWLSETDATIYAGKSVRWLRSHFAEWERAGHGRYRMGHRQYRMMALPRRANPQAAYEAGKQAGKDAAA
jgi:hypothetical protein